MSTSKFFTVFLLLVITFISCNNGDTDLTDDQNPDVEQDMDTVLVDRIHDCTFEQIDENMDGRIDDNERMIMTECIANSIVSKSSIESNLIGEWELIGYGHSWVPFPSQPCGYINISEDELTIEYMDGDTTLVSSHDWEIEEVVWSNGQIFSLNISPAPIRRFEPNRFCENYMFVDDTPVDGNMYLFTRIE